MATWYAVIGITGTPVIDPSTGTMFVVSYDDEGGNLVYRLHALNVLTGADKWPAIVISASGPGTGVGSSGGTVSFNPGTNRQRVALLLENGKIYVAFSSFCDIGAYHGWILGYSYSTTAFTLANAPRRHSQRERWRHLERKRRSHRRRPQRQRVLHKR